MEESKREREGLVFWTDGSRKGDELVGCTVLWKEEGVWKKGTEDLRKQKKPFNEEMYAMLEVMNIAEEISGDKEVLRVTVFTDSQATLTQVQWDEPGPGEVLRYER